MDEEIRTVVGELSAQDLKFGLVAARFNDLIVDSLVRGAVDALLRHGAERRDLELVRVAGAFELPLVLQRMAASRRFDALVALGCVIRGATPHFDYVAGECSRGIQKVSLEFSIPVGFGVLTCETVDQALERAGTKAGNKGADAAISALETARLLRALER